MKWKEEIKKSFENIRKLHFNHYTVEAAKQHKYVQQHIIKEMFTKGQKKNEN